MGAVVAALPYLAATAAVAGATTQVVESRAQARNAEAQGRRQQRAQQTLVSNLEGEKNQAEQDRIRFTERARQRTAAYAGGRRSTILTSPLGIIGQPAGGGKTLLGQ